MFTKRLLPGLCCLLGLTVHAQYGPDIAARASFETPSPWSVHFQLTTVDMGHFSFPAKYSGPNSLVDTPEHNITSLTTSFFLGRKLWKGAAVYFNPEVSGGRGLSHATGMAGFPNGETFRIGDPSPAIYTARFFLQQNIPLGHTGYIIQEDDVNQVRDSIPIERLTLSIGKFSLDDFFDDNLFSHDPRAQFLNWSLMSNGAWDYPANTRGYTVGLVAELFLKGFAIRGSMVQEPRQANGPDMDPDIFKYYGLTLELEKPIKIGDQPGTIRLLGFFNQSRAIPYTQVLQEVKQGDSSNVGVFSGATLSNGYGNKKGWGLSANQNIDDNVGVFLRASWNDGKTGTWAFTEIDQSASAGVQVLGKLWKRPNDVVGGAFVLNGISSGHQDYLKAGLTGFMLGDGNLNYGHEGVAEFYYSARLFAHVFLSADYQWCKNPGYNRDRGPVSIYGFRGHIEF
ncbi:carbohydrate porin [Dinghuibacter silviterrae]|uniref:High affinity Mn2+ porin n=1 Tax=Dinghuibacter silviterrae TaxID=1539049 RepID=A0A4R8DWP7_9BACT|nr:carbohydrate porin [Dinghuibacter silviterrae]TDX01631.1 high affinity Mn2+ porin [Dinghuibacter silviterrae]